jgi:hypothetical protein
VDQWTGGLGADQQPVGGGQHVGGLVFIRDAVWTALLTQMLAERLAVLGYPHPWTPRFAKD